jgi:hypothetical protein
MRRLIQRSGAPYRFKATMFKTLDEAVWAARESDEDYLIEDLAEGVIPVKVVKYRLGEFELN